jgi:hypothetical protein
MFAERQFPESKRVGREEGLNPKQNLRRIVCRTGEVVPSSSLCRCLSHADLDYDFSREADIKMACIWYASGNNLPTTGEDALIHQIK